MSVLVWAAVIGEDGEPTGEKERLYGHPSTANAWLEEEAAVREKHGERDVTMAALIFYSDKTTSRSIGQLSYYPLYMTLANYEADVFAEMDTKVTVGFILTLKRPDKANTNLWSDAVNDLHMLVWGAVVDSLNRAIRDEPLVIPLKDNDPLPADLSAPTFLRQ